MWLYSDMYMSQVSDQSDIPDVSYSTVTGQAPSKKQLEKRFFLFIIFQIEVGDYNGKW